MSIQEAVIARSYPHILSTRIESLIEQEIVKGCQPDLYPLPTELEPKYQIISRKNYNEDLPDNQGVLFQHSSVNIEPVRLNVWLNPEDSFDWIKPELFIKQLSSSRERFSFEIYGNEERIILSFLCSKNDLPLLQAALRGQYPECGTSFSINDYIAKFPLRYWEKALFYDYYPHPPYSHLLTRPLELQKSPLESLIYQLMVIPKSAVGLYQVIFQPVNRNHDWHRNVEILLDLEYKLSLHQDGFASGRLPQQSPTMDLRTASQDINNKAHNDKPFYVAALRTLFISEKVWDNSYIQALNSTVNVFQHGGKSLNQLTENDYLNRFPPATIQEMFSKAITYRPGFLLNSWELTGLVHLPISEKFLRRKIEIPLQEMLIPRINLLKEGTFVGYCNSPEGQRPIYVPQNIRLRHTHILGKNGVGKSILMESMAISDLLAGHGIAVFDPHGDLVEGLMKKIS